MKKNWQTDDAPFLWLIGEISKDKDGLEVIKVRDELCRMHTYWYLYEKGKETCEKEKLLEMYENEKLKGVQGFVESYNKFVM